MTPVAPSVKALAEQHGIDLSTVAGTGKGGAIKKTDVEALIGGGSSSGSSGSGSSSSSSGSKTKELYCPGCGKRTTETSPAPCTGGEFPHQPIAFVSTAELDGPAEKHTPAPPSE